MIKRKLALAVLAVAAVAAGCGGTEETLSGITELSGLRGRSVGVASLDSTATLALRYVLQESYGLAAAPEGGDVMLVEAPAPELLMLLADGEVEAVLLPPGSSFEDSEEVRLLSRVTQEARELTGVPIASSVLLTYPDIAEQKLPGLIELKRMLTEGTAYLDANRDDVLKLISADQEADEDEARAWWSALSLRFGDSSSEAQAEIASIWQVATALGDIDDAPPIADAVLPEGVGEAPGIEVPEEGEEPDTGDRTTISLAVLDDVSRRAALYAIEQGIVASESIDLSVTYLAPSEMIDAPSARQFDVVEATPLAVPLGLARDLEFVIVSGGEQDLDGALLVVANGG